MIRILWVALLPVAVGWCVVGELPDLDKFIVIGAPHTSNWDYILLLAIAVRGPLAGRYPRQPRPFQPGRRRGRRVHPVAPEATRKKTRYWRTGTHGKFPDQAGAIRIRQ